MKAYTQTCIYISTYINTYTQTYAYLQIRIYLENINTQTYIINIHQIHTKNLFSHNQLLSEQLKVNLLDGYKRYSNN